MSIFRTIAAAALVTVSAASYSHAIFGVGIHYGLDFSMGMKDAKDEAVRIPDGFGFDINIPDEISQALGMTGTVINVPSSSEFFKVDRSNFKSHPINFGMKAYIDIIPVLDIIEVSANFGVWQYDGVVQYMSIDGSDNNVVEKLLAGNYTYVPQPMTIDAFYSGGFFGLSATPYAKLQLDASIRKKVLDLPIFKLSAGGGFTVNFTTPILNDVLVEDVRADKKMSPEQFLDNLAKNNDIGEAIVDKIISELFTPRYGAHIVAGVNIKLPAIPLAFYADGKFMIPISKLDENKQVTGTGVMFNAGVAFAL